MLDNFCDMRVVLGRCEGVIIIEFGSQPLIQLCCEVNLWCEGVIIIELVAASQIQL